MIKNYLKLLVALVFATNVIAQNVPSYVPKDGLVGWWPFNENANDESGNGNHGTVYGATLTADRNGNPNSAYSFDGNKNYIKTNLKSLNSTSISISVWFLVDDKGFLGGNHRTLVSSRTSNSNFVGIGFYKQPYLYFDIPTQRCSTNYNLPTDYKWHNIIVTFDGNKQIIYIDGINSANKTFLNTFNSLLSNNVLFGLDEILVGDNRYWRGQLDDIAIYNRALSDQEVKQLYEGCTKETATSNSFNSYAFTNNSSINLSANPAEGTFSGEAVTNNAFNPSKAKLGKNQVKYAFKNSTGCADSTNFEMIMVDTLGNKCSTYDTLKIKVQLTTGIKSGQVATMNVYPNPTSDVIIIEASDVAALNGYSYKMVDLQGKQVYKELVTKSKTEISLKSIGAKGVYILHVVDAQGVSIENKKIVLE